jgi:hypothetical protein
MLADLFVCVCVCVGIFNMHFEDREFSKGFTAIMDTLTEVINQSTKV